MVRCDVEGYKCRTQNGRVYVFNGIYESKWWLILLAALCEAFLPDRETFRIPMALCIQDNGKDIVINKKLEVTGADQYEYFIPKEHYAKWKYTYALVYFVVAIFVFAATIIALYIFFKSSFNLAAGLIALVLGVSYIMICLRMKCQRKLLQKLTIRTMI